MLRLLIDENLDQRILRGVRLQLPSLDYLVVQDTELQGASGERILEWAVESQRIIVTHDVNTVTKYAYERLQNDVPMAGVIVIPEDLAIGTAIEDLILMIECCTAEELNGQVRYLPI